MTNEPLSTKRRQQAEEAERHGDLGTAWAFREDADALDAKDARIAELERDRDQANESWHYANGVAELAMKHRDEDEAKCERLRAALREAQDAFQDSRIGTTGMDTPEFYQMLWRASDRVALALADTPERAALTVDQQGEREDEIHRATLCIVRSAFTGWIIEKDSRFFSGPYGRYTDAIDALRALRDTTP